MLVKLECLPQIGMKIQKIFEPPRFECLKSQLVFSMENSESGQITVLRVPKPESFEHFGQIP